MKRCFWIALLVASVQSSWGYALLGPLTLANGADSWQSIVIGYDYVYVGSSVSGDSVFLGDIGGPRNWGEGYRRNTPVVYYTYDSTFINFFGPDGMTAVDGAYALMNTIPAADQIDLSQYPDQSMQDNYTAQADFLTDLKSVTLHLLVEQMGLADPERFLWTLHDRYLPPGGVCPIDEIYTVVQRNFADEPSALNQVQYSDYINDTLYSYFIAEICAGNPTLAWTVPFSPDPNALNYQSVAANNYDGNGVGYLQLNGSIPTTLSGGLQVGSFYTGLTRDDVAGLKHLYHTNSIAWELPDPTALMFNVTTNQAQQGWFPALTSTNVFGTNGVFYTYDGTYGYGDYNALLAASLIYPPAVLQVLYPGLVVDNSYQIAVTLTNYTYNLYYTNQVGVQYPAPPLLVTITNKTLVPGYWYQTSFKNVFVFTNRASSTVLQTVTVGPQVGAQYPAPAVTNSTYQALAQTTNGYFFIYPMFQTNICPLDFILNHASITNVLATTNLLTVASNIQTITTTTITNTSSYSSTLMQISYFTNYYWKIYPVTCAETAPVANLYQGIGGVQFQRADYDSEFSQYFTPITNYYNMVMYTNYQWSMQPMVRVVTQPDILMDAVDEGVANSVVGTVLRTINFTPSPLLNGLAGPGTINNSPVTGAPVRFSYDKIGNSAWNSWGYFIQDATSDFYLDERESVPAIRWASFDASTNAPEVYPNGTTIQNLENQLVVKLLPTSVADGKVGTPYSLQFSASGGGFTTPFTWSATAATITTGLYYGLPPGMSLSSTGLLYGTPITAGTYDFALKLTDSSQSASHIVTWNLSITIDP